MDAPKTIKLNVGDNAEEFSFEQAQSILQIQTQMNLDDYRLPEDSPFIFVNNGLEYRPVTRKVKGASKEGDTGGNPA